jgi:3,4-dihydroxy 2-butanone 4-phosphate synthase/GTP cyclohydrolase II
MGPRAGPDHPGFWAPKPAGGVLPARAAICHSPPAMSDWRDRIQQAIEDYRQGRMVILVDDEDRENEGDLCLPAELVTPEAINFMAKHARGLICLTLTEERIRRLNLPMMVPENASPLGTAFTVSVEAAKGVSTGISAADRATTVQAAVADDAVPSDLISPGHVFPLLAKPGGVLVRTGQTEGSVDLARLAGLRPAGVICEIMNDDGTMARMPELEAFAAEHGLTIVTVADIIRQRLERESLVEAVRDVEVVLGDSGAWRAKAYVNQVDSLQHLALIKGDISGDSPTLVRVHTGCPLGDVFANAACDCGPQLQTTLARIAEEGRGVLLYLHRDLRTLATLIDQHVLGRKGEASEPVGPAAQPGMPPTLRDFGIGAQILRDQGLGRIRLLTNNPKKIKGLEGYGLDVIERLPLAVEPTPENIAYLRSRREEGQMLRKATEER